LWKGVPVNHKRVHRLLQDFHLSLKRATRRPKPNPLLQIVLLAGDKADLRALLLKQREPEPFELLYTDFTLLPYRVVSRCMCKRLCTGGIPLLKHLLQHLPRLREPLEPSLRPPPFLPLRL
jgi:hypothetical protein